MIELVPPERMKMLIVIPVRIRPDCVNQLG